MCVGGGGSAVEMKSSAFIAVMGIFIILLFALSLPQLSQFLAKLSAAASNK